MALSPNEMKDLKPNKWSIVRSSRQLSFVEEYADTTVYPQED